MSRLYRLCRDMQTYIFPKHLLGNALSIDRLVLDIISLVDQPRHRKLLFQDGRIGSSDPSTLHGPSEAAIFYVGNVLFSRKTQLPKHAEIIVTNAHCLLECLCRLAQEPRWADACVGRHQNADERIEDFFFRTHAVLHSKWRAEQKNGTLGKRVPKVRAAHGALWLTAAASAAPVPEEMALEDVLQAAPVPLHPEIVEDQETGKRLQRVLENLNKRYGALYACGLDPELWLDREQPSTNALSQLKTLKQRADSRMEGFLHHGAAYRDAFASLLVEHGTSRWGGFASFDDFAHSEVGAAMLKQQTFLHSDAETEGGIDLERRRYNEDLDENPEHLASLDQLIEQLPAQYAQVFSPLMQLYFIEVLAHGRPLHGARGLLHNSEFLRLQAQDPEFQGLQGHELAASLKQAAERLIQGYGKLEDPQERAHARETIANLLFGTPRHETELD